MKTELDKNTGLIYSVQDLQMRLGKSLVRYDGRPYFIMAIDGRTVMGIFTDNEREYTFKLPDTKLDVRPVPLGYANTGAEALYLSRVPQRRYKQGLSEESLKVLGRHAARRLLTSKPLAECILNKYPSYVAACKRVREDKRVSSVAFSRKFCVEKDDTGLLFLRYRHEKVGWVNKYQPELGESHQYLAEELAIATGEGV